ncbi:MAG: hypothetical protein GX080_02555 [Tissierellia bacterium]|nr:hypothetical protein [Tissierellia bacterium]
MSNVIKSFKVVVGEAPTEEDIELKSETISNEVLNEAKEKYKKIILEANKKAESIIDSAHKEYEDHLNEAYEKANSIFEDSKQRGYKEGYNSGVDEGFKKGYTDGYEEGKSEAQKLIDGALKLKEEYIKMRSQLLDETEEDIINLVISIYEKVIYKKVEEDKELIISLVQNGIKDLEIKGKLTIIVSKDDYEIIQENKKLILAEATLIDEVEIRVDNDMNKGDCILETSKGDVDISISNQLEEIKELIISILNNE